MSFGDPSCIGFWDNVREKDSVENPTDVTAVVVGNEW